MEQRVSFPVLLLCQASIAKIKFPLPLGQRRYGQIIEFERASWRNLQLQIPCAFLEPPTQTAHSLGVSFSRLGVGFHQNIINFSRDLMDPIDDGVRSKNIGG